MKFVMALSPRRLTQYIGAIIGIVGVGLCLSVIVQAFSMIEPSASHAILGMAFAVVGGAVSGALRILLATSGSDAVSGRKGGEIPAAIKVRCPLCQELNDEYSRSCSQCGRRL